MNEGNVLIKFLVMDVDGTLTDGMVYMAPSGEAMKAFNIKDGYGIHDILIPLKIRPVIITGRESQIVLNRCKELGIEAVYQSVSDKVAKLQEVTKDLSEVAYIGDDINDLACMVAVREAGGVVGCPANAVKIVKEIADYISEHNGGDGAVRDFIEWITTDNK
jgi:3-deoxy-D-manno-octulosonate 8-phosphate phosphatase (KDO 8-P phosphatase)